MSTKRSHEGGPKRASRRATEGADPLMDELYHHRERLQLGTEFHVIGNLHNWAREWTDDVLPTPRIAFLESIFIDQATLNGTRPNSPSGVKPARPLVGRYFKVQFRG